MNSDEPLSYFPRSISNTSDNEDVIVCDTLSGWRVIGKRAENSMGLYKLVFVDLRGNG